MHHGPPDASGIKDLLERSKIVNQQILDCKQQGRKLLTHIKQYDAYMDIGPLTHSFKILDRQYPGSKFIYTNRATDKWLESMSSHVTRNQKNVGEGLYETNLVNVNVEKWRNTKEKHFRQVKEYFKGRESDLLIMNIVKGDGYELLCPFLGIEMIEEPFPRKIRRASRTVP